MSNCVVGSGGFGVPDDVVAEHGVERGDHLSHDGNDDDLWFLVGGGKTIMEDFESGIVSGGAHGGHVEDVTDRQTSAI
jgi:predicted Rossmann-fold nucleotide-binding protein